MTERYARITGWGKYLPTRRLTNYDLEQMVETNDEWITHNTGIRERRIAEPQETTVNMALNAALMALERASMRAEDLDMVIFATSSPDYFVPASASLCRTGWAHARPVRSTLRPVAPVFCMAWSPPPSLSRPAGSIAFW